MAEGGFNELELLSQEELIVGALRQFLKAYAEFGRRGEVIGDFLRSLCRFSPEASVWLLLWESGGAQRFTDILKATGYGREKMSKVLGGLLNAELVRMVEGRYQAVSPACLVRFSEPKRRTI